jgi:hypothetical protein
VKKALGIAVVIVLAVVAYRYFSARGVETQYERFAEEILHRRYESAAAMADGLTAADLEKLGSQERIGAGPVMFQTLFPSRFRILSRETAADGGVVLHANQTVLFNPVGVESAIRPAMYARLAQVVTLNKRDGQWRVTAFSNTFEEMDSVKP